MKRLARIALSVVLLGIPFAITSVLAGVVGLIVSPWYPSRAYPHNLLRASDKQAATLLGWSGRATISAECGASTCKPCALLCRVLDWIQRGHCAGAAQREGTTRT